MAMRLRQCWAIALLWAWRPLHADAFVSPVPTTYKPRYTTILHADAFVNFEGLQRKLNLTHFEDPEIENRPLPPNEDFANRPDIVKAKEIAEKLAPEYRDDNYVTVCLYFHVFPWHLQSFREALQDFIEAQKAAEGEDGVYWEAFQLVALPEECRETRSAVKQAGRVPSRCRVLLSGTFRDQDANDGAKRAVVAWRRALLERLKGYNLVMGDPVETMPMSQAVYRRLSPLGPVKPPGASVPLGHDSVFLLSVIQASWSSERKIRLHVEQMLEYREKLLATGGAVRAECAQDPQYPSAHRIWHRFDSMKDLVACMDGAYADLIENGAKFRARVNHVEQAFRPIIQPATSVLSVGLSTGHRLPLVGYGTSVFQGREREGNMRLHDALLLALQSGCRLVDCSPEYRQQEEVGSAIASALATGVTTRERLFVIASLHTDTVTGWLRSPDSAAVRADVSRTLSTLGLDYVDALLLPYPASWDRDGKLSGEQLASLQSLWSALEGLVSGAGQGGVARHLGVKDMPLEVVQLLDERPHTVPIDVCMVEMHPFYVDFDLVEYCLAQDDARLRVVASTPLGRTAPSRPPGDDVLKESFITKTADALGCTPAQVVLRWLVQQGIAVVPNSLSAGHILANGDLGTFNLADLRVQALYEMSDIRQLRLGRLPTDKGAPFSLSEVREGRLLYLDDGQRVGKEYQYEQIDLDMVERMELGDGRGTLRIEPRVINGAFPGMDFEPVEP